MPRREPSGVGSRPFGRQGVQHLFQAKADGWKFTTDHVQYDFKADAPMPMDPSWVLESCSRSLGTRPAAKSSACAIIVLDLLQDRKREVRFYPKHEVHLDLKRDFEFKVESRDFKQRGRLAVRDEEAQVARFGSFASYTGAKDARRRHGVAAALVGSSVVKRLLDGVQIRPG